MKKTVVAVCLLVIGLQGMGQKVNKDSLFRARKDSSLRAAFHADSVRLEKEFAEEAHWENIKSSAVFPVINGGEYSGVIPVANPTEVPDPAMQYKLLFELTTNNPDSASKNNNYGLVEVARLLNTCMWHLAYPPAR